VAAEKEHTACRESSGARGRMHEMLDALLADPRVLARMGWGAAYVHRRGRDGCLEEQATGVCGGSGQARRARQQAEILASLMLLEGCRRTPAKAGA